MTQSPLAHLLPERKRALIILNAQNDSLVEDGDIFHVETHRNVPQINKLIPYFRRDTLIIWVCKRMEPGKDFHQEGTKGAEMFTIQLMDEAKDLIMIIPHSSQFVETSLLTALRMHVVLDIYICGFFVETDVHSGVQELVRHGLRVIVIEDCLGYRGKQKHGQAIIQMKESFGVEIMDSEGIICEYGGQPMPDMRPCEISLHSLSVDTDEDASGDFIGSSN